MKDLEGSTGSNEYDGSRLISAIGYWRENNKVYGGYKGMYILEICNSRFDRALGYKKEFRNFAFDVPYKCNFNSKVCYPLLWSNFRRGLRG